jgi:uncharacterized membrane protein YGL010W
MRFVVPAPMRARLAEYEGFHRSSANELCHFVGIPAIIVGAASLLALASFGAVAGHRLSLADLVAAAIVVFYVAQARWLGVVTGALLAGLVLLGRALPWTAGLALFLGGWALQFVGHALYEKRSPAFLKNLLHLLVGPAWLVERAFERGAH